MFYINSDDDLNEEEIDEKDWKNNEKRKRTFIERLRPNNMIEKDKHIEELE
jgi:hypothetical protein